MVSIFLRTVVIYIILVGSMRLMGKRQLGELEVSELVTTILLSEIATLPIENMELPIMYAVLPIVTILAIEISLSVMLIKFPRLKNVFSSRPSVIIRKGRIIQKELLKNRISIDELITELRQNSFTDISEVQYAIIEQNGKISIIPKAKYRQPTLSDLKISSEESGLAHILISDGYTNSHNLKLIGKSEDWLNAYMKKEGVVAKDVFLMLIDDSDKTILIKKDKK